MSLMRWQGMGGGKTPERRQVEKLWLEKLGRAAPDEAARPAAPGHLHTEGDPHEEGAPSKKKRRTGNKTAPSKKTSLVVKIPSGRAGDSEAGEGTLDRGRVQGGRDLSLADQPPPVPRVAPPELTRRKERDASKPSKRRRLPERQASATDEGSGEAHSSGRDTDVRPQQVVDGGRERTGTTAEELLGGETSRTRARSAKKEEYVYSAAGRQPLLMLEWDGGSGEKSRKCYASLVEYVMDTQSVSKRAVDGLHQVWFRELLKRAAAYTPKAAVCVINNRQPASLQTRPFLESRVEALARVYDKEEAKPAIVVVQDRRDDTSTLFTKEQAVAGGRAEREWRGGNPSNLFKAIEDRRSSTSELFAFTCVGNHSTEAASKVGVTRWAAYIFFRSHLREEDFVFMSKTENEIAKAAAATTADYDEYAQPLKLIPFLRDIWVRHGRPTAKGSKRSGYVAYIRNVDGVLEREAPEVDEDGDTWWTRCAEVQGAYEAEMAAAYQLKGLQRTEALAKVGTALGMGNRKWTPCIIRCKGYQKCRGELRSCGCHPSVATPRRMFECAYTDDDTVQRNILLFAACPDLRAPTPWVS